MSGGEFQYVPRRRGAGLWQNTLATSRRIDVGILRHSRHSETYRQMYSVCTGHLQLTAKTETWTHSMTGMALHIEGVPVSGHNAHHSLRLAFILAWLIFWGYLLFSPTAIGRI